MQALAISPSHVHFLGEAELRARRGPFGFSQPIQLGSYERGYTRRPASTEAKSNGAHQALMSSNRLDEGNTIHASIRQDECALKARAWEQHRFLAVDVADHV